MKYGQSVEKATRRVAWDAFVNGVLASRLIPRSIRWRLLRVSGLRGLCRSTICSGVFIGGSQISIGHRTFVNHEVFFDTSGTIVIGANCQIGMRVMFVTGTHKLGGLERRAAGSVARPIVVGDGAWIGAGAVILPGVSVGSGAVVGAGAVVTRDVQIGDVVAGNPARSIEAGRSSR